MYTRILGVCAGNEMKTLVLSVHFHPDRQGIHHPQSLDTAIQNRAAEFFHYRTGCKYIEHKATHQTLFRGILLQRSSHARDVSAKRQEHRALSTPEQSLTNQNPQLHRLYAEGDDLIEEIRSRNSPRIYIISGPSGVGKDTVIEQLREAFPDAQYVVTATTRPMRTGEVDGVHYQFMSKEDFVAGISADAFIENALVYDNHYCVPKQPILDGLAANRDVIIKVDVKGAATLRRLIHNTISIFLAPESMEALLTRLRDRKTDDPDVLMKRFRTASIELAEVAEFDYVVFNEDDRLDAAVNSIVNIVNVERLKVKRPNIVVPQPGRGD